MINLPDLQVPSVQVEEVDSPEMTIYAFVNFYSIFGSKNEKRQANARILSFLIQRLSVNLQMHMLFYAPLK